MMNQTNDKVGQKRMTKDVFIYDTTLRDGEQGENIAFSLEDKISIATRLDEFGIDYIEGGWPGSNPKAMRFFEKMKSITLRHAKLVAFGSTRRKGIKAEDDKQVAQLLKCGASVVTIFGKTWDLHVREALRVTPEENLAMIYDTVAFLKSNGREVIYDAEHFFDGFKANPEYSLETLRQAVSAGADCVTLCDTNGGTMPTEIPAILEEVRKVTGTTRLGIHTHNDAGMAVANTIIACRHGVSLVQGTINGFGERCGNADLIQIIPNLELKYAKNCLPEGQLKNLTAVSHFVCEVANLAPNPNQPYVGQTVFTHKGGIHVSAVQRNSSTYEHIDPEVVGNRRRVLVSELSGSSNIEFKAKELGINIDTASEETKKILLHMKELEADGYQFEGAEASFEILVQKGLGIYHPFFKLKGFRVIVGNKDGAEIGDTEAVVRLDVNGDDRYTVADGNGPVDALDRALRRALVKNYPELNEVKLTDFKVRVLDARSATAAKVRVIIESTDQHATWTTVGVSTDMVEAAYLSLVDSIDYFLYKRRNGKDK